MRYTRGILPLLLPLLLLSLLLPACGRDASPAIDPGNDSNNDTQPSDTSPFVTVALDYVGIRNTHWISQLGGDPYARIQLIVSVRDEQNSLKTMTIPPEGTEGFDMDFFEVRALGDNTDPRVFAGRVTGSLSLYVAAYNVNKGPITKAQLDLISAWTGTDYSFLKSFISDRELVGAYWRTFSPSQLQEIGGNFEGSDGNLIAWFRVWSATEPAAVSRPELSPDVRIESLQVPAYAEVSLGLLTVQYPTTFTVVNNESFDIPIRWEANSSTTGTYDSGSFTVPAKGSWCETRNYHYQQVGHCEITYSIYGNWGDQRKLDTKSGTVVVSP